MIHDSVATSKGSAAKSSTTPSISSTAYKYNREYAIQTSVWPPRRGADVLVLCDTNGGSFPWEIEEITRAVAALELAPLGCHTHNDSGNAVGNALGAVRAGAVQVQGTINGYGERCGNVNLCVVIPNLVHKMGVDCMDRELVGQLTELSWYVSEVANVTPTITSPTSGAAPSRTRAASTSAP